MTTSVPLSRWTVTRGSASIARRIVGLPMLRCRTASRHTPHTGRAAGHPVVPATTQYVGAASNSPSTHDHAGGSCSLTSPYIRSSSGRGSTVSLSYDLGPPAPHLGAASTVVVSGHD